MKDQDKHAGRFWLELREPGWVPERKGPWLLHGLASILREFMAVRPTAYITVVTIGHDGPSFQDGPEALQMADGRSVATGSKHIARTSEAHAPHRSQAPTDPNLIAALGQACQGTMSAVEVHAQRRSWVIGQMGPSHPEMTHAQLMALVDEALGSAPVEPIGPSA